MGFRPEIQALRALAVTLVVVFHLWPDALSGGYVGVDVFFVISGYLITGHLWSEVERTGTVSLAEFWSRRLRRLLPAAAVVLVASVGLMLLVVPRPLWQQTVVEVGASALWVQNWVLAAGSVDYLAADGTPTLVQHFWSLSVEEQFYLVWPVLLLAAVAALRARRVAVRWMLAGLAIASVVYSVLQADAASGYFNTGTRAWEFAAGGLLALSPALVASLRRRAGLARIAAYGGFGMILVSALLYTSGTPFPGAAAALPVVGAVLVIAGGSDDAATVFGRAVRLRGVQSVGDLSYSIYLWHWPLILVGAYLPIASGWWPLPALVLTLVLAALTKRFIEDPARAAQGTRRTYRMAVAAIASIVVISTATWGVVQGATVASAQTALAKAQTDPCFGAAAIAERCADPFAMSAQVDTAFAAQDRGVLWEECPHGAEVVATCRYGALEDYTRTVAVVGNSHAAALIPGLDTYAKHHGWRVLLLRKTDCLGVSTLDLAGAGGSSCADWTRRVLTDLENRTDVDLVLFGTHSNAMHYLAATDSSAREVRELKAEIGETFRSLLSSGKRVVVVGDTPGTRPIPAPECVYLHRADNDPCAAHRGSGQEDGNIEAVVARATPDVEYLSLMPFVCTERCHALVGGVVVYFDDHHLSGSFSRSLAPYLGAALDPR